MPHAGVGGQFLLKGLAFLAQDILPGTQRAQRCFLDFGIDETFGEWNFLHGIFIRDLRELHE